MGSRPEVAGAILDSAHRDCLLVDPWNALGSGSVFSYPAEIAILSS